MSKDLSPEKMLLRVMRVAEILVKSTDLKSNDTPEIKHVQNEVDKSQTPPMENTKQ
jgi:hypothetical protein